VNAKLHAVGHQTEVRIQRATNALVGLFDARHCRYILALDKARYEAEAGLSRRGFVRDGLWWGESLGSVGVDGDGEEEENKSEDGLEGLMNNGSDRGGKKQTGMGC